MKKLFKLFFITILMLFVINQAPVLFAYSSTETVIRNNGEEETKKLTNVVIFIRFNDETDYTAPFTYEYYTNMFNGENVVSLRDYYLEASYNKMDITSYFTSDTQIIFYTDIYDRSYFEPYDKVRNPNGYEESESSDREHYLLKRAIDYVDANNLIDSSINLDQDNDGIVDSVSFLISGEDNGWNSLLWPHMWELYTFNSGYLGYTQDAPTLNGKHIYTYTFELLGDSINYNYAVNVAILAHETFHLIGAPDLYHYYDYDWIDGVGYWGLMSSLYDIPSHMLGYMKQTYGGWIDNVQEITESGSYTLYPLMDSPNNIYRYNTGYSNEYVYFEFRQEDGLYETNLPDTGLIVYRVDQDLYDAGNVNGYYNNDGDPAEEVFVFRPGIEYDNGIVFFPDTDDPHVEEDGYENLAALSNLNQYDEMGTGTNIPMFYSDGTPMDITVTNVVDHGEYITFDVILPTLVKLNLNDGITLDNTFNLVDVPGTMYTVTFDNIPNDAVVYYTTDGSTPTTASTVWNNEEIVINYYNNQVQALVYLNGELFDTVNKEYTFVNTVESSHNPYGNMLNQTWVINFETETNFQLDFDGRSEFELDYDYLYITSNGVTNEYTGTELANLTLDFTSQTLRLNLVTDQYVDEYYGFSCDIIFSNEVLFGLNSSETLTVSINSDWIDPGYFLYTTQNYYVLTESNLDLNNFGTYLITYSLYNPSNVLVESVTREVTVADIEAPNITVIGNQEITINVFDNYLDEGIEVIDNYDSFENLIITIDNPVDPNVVGTYTITYSAVDTFGNESEIMTRTVNVVDTIAPTASLIGDYEIYIDVFGIYEELGLTVSDNYNQTEDITIDIVANVKVDVVGIYLVRYKVYDSSGNMTEIERKVHIVDSIAPTATINGDSVIDLEVFSIFTDPGVLATDNYNESKDIDVEIDTDLDMTKLGSYTITYTVIDSSGNSSEYSRTVNVVDTLAPTITLNPSVDTIQLGNEYVDLGITAIDNYDQNPNINVIESIDINTEGNYTVTYEVTDQSGNKTTISKIVNVIPKDKVVFECSKNQTTYTINSDYEVPTCKVFGEDVEPNTSDINSSLTGTYQIVYQYTYKNITYTHYEYIFFIGDNNVTELAIISNKEEENEI